MIQQDTVTKLRDMIIDQTEVAVANYFSDNAMLAYESETSISALDDRAVMAYDACKESIKKFMSKILLADMLANDINYAECTLILPDGECNINIGVDCDSHKVSAESDDQEVVRTKIGSFDLFTWQMLCDIKKEQNPVKIFYEHIENNLEFIMNKLNWSKSDLSQKTINADLMDEYHIQEPIKTHHLINLYYGVSEFCNEVYKGV